MKAPVSKFIYFTLFDISATSIGPKLASRMMFLSFGPSFGNNFIKKLSFLVTATINVGSLIGLFHQLVFLSSNKLFRNVIGAFGLLWQSRKGVLSDNIRRLFVRSV